MNGPLFREPYSKPLENGIFEFRSKQGSDITRVLYFFFFTVGKKAVLTNGFGDAQKIQRAAAELETKDFNDLTTFCVWLGLKTDPKGVKRGSYIMPASAIEHVFFSRTGIDEDRLKMLRIKKYSDLESGTIM